MRTIYLDYLSFSCTNMKGQWRLRCTRPLTQGQTGLYTAYVTFDTGIRVQTRVLDKFYNNNCKYHHILLSVKRNCEIMILKCIFSYILVINNKLFLPWIWLSEVIFLLQYVDGDVNIFCRQKHSCNVHKDSSRPWKKVPRSHPTWRVKTVAVCECWGLDGIDVFTACVSDRIRTILWYSCWHTGTFRCSITWATAFSLAL